MNLAALVFKSLIHHWRANVPTMLCVAVAVAVLVGALIVGDSMRGSLAELALARLGDVEYLVKCRHFVREQLAEDLTEAPDFPDHFAKAVPAILLDGAVACPESGSRANRVNVLGIDARFWTLNVGNGPSIRGDWPERSVAINEPLARKLRIQPGQDLMVYLPYQSDIPAETLLGRRDRAGQAVRLVVQEVISPEGLGAFSLNLSQHEPLNVYVPLRTVQRTLKQLDRINSLLVAGHDPSLGRADSRSDLLPGLLRKVVRLDDVGLRFRSERRSAQETQPADRRMDECVVLESRSILIPSIVERAAEEAATELKWSMMSVQACLANTISLERESFTTQPARKQVSTWTVTGNVSEIPYSTVVAVGWNSAPGMIESPLSSIATLMARLGSDEIVLNEWAAADLGAQPGDRIRLTYYVTGSFDRLETRTSSCILRNILPMRGLAVDRNLVPDYEGMTDAKQISDWNPPFPIDLSRIRSKDEDYWDRYGPMPKAFISFQTGQAFLEGEGGRFGRLTSMRFYPPGGSDVSLDRENLERTLCRRLDPSTLGVTVDPVRAKARQAAEGTTDFGVLFLGFSIFLIVSAAMLIALTFQLGLDQRVFQVGLFLATGFRVRRIMLLLFSEGMIIATAGTLLGVAGGLVYAEMMLAGLRSWWSAPIAHVSFLHLHVKPMTLCLGAGLGCLIALLVIFRVATTMCRHAPQVLLSGRSDLDIKPYSRSGYLRLITSAGLLLLGLLLVVLALATETQSPVGAFWGCGVAMLAAGLINVSGWLHKRPAGHIVTPGNTAFFRLGIRNIRRYPRRNLLAAGLIAVATFIIVSIGFNHRVPGNLSVSKDGGSEGFVALAESSIPILQDMNTPEGRKVLGLSKESINVLSKMQIMPLRVRQGDEANCLNLYQTTTPLVYGVPESMIERGGFAFQKSIAQTQEEKNNPWRLLRRTFSDNAIPAIGDANTVMWLLHLGLGQDLAIHNERGQLIYLRIVGMLSESILQGGLLISEGHFQNHWPAIRGYRMFLFESSQGDQANLSSQTTGSSTDLMTSMSVLETDLADYGFDVSLAKTRLAAYLEVENTYLSTFKVLGGLGLVLGTLGLAAVLLRNTWERRKELGLLQALGYRRYAIGLIIISENAVILLLGMAIGTVSAGMAVFGHIMSRTSTVSWFSIMLMLAGVLTFGLLAGIAALVTVFRFSALSTLRSD